jgi:formamidopyrimidine-DNA glycosylase
MPELPEVETIKRGLSKRLDGKTIVNIDVKNVESFQGDPKSLIDSKIVSIERRAKVIRFRLSNELNLLFHLKMTGQLIHEHLKTDNRQLITDFAGGHPSHDWHAKLPNSNTRIIFEFNDKSKLFFNDMRKFGWCKVLSNEEIEAIFKKDYGLEPLDKDFTVEYLLEKGKHIPNRNAKQFLMDQTICAGMGNIYTDEALFDARISPKRKIKDIKISEWKTLISSMRKVLEMGIKYGGTTDSDYVDAEGHKGGMQEHLRVYHRKGKDCLNNCGSKVERIKIGGRGTHFCPKCQK